MKNPVKTFSKEIILQALKDSFKKFNPKTLVKNPVMFIVSLGALVTTLEGIKNGYSAFNIQIIIWLWFTVLFANFAEAIAEGRGKAQANSLRQNRTNTMARRLKGNKEEIINAQLLKKNDLVVCEAGDIIPGDGEVVEGIAYVDESAITGESAPVIRESGGDRSAVTGGTKVISDKIIIKIIYEPGNSFLDKLISLVEGAKRKKTPNEIALMILLIGLSIIFVLAVASLPQFYFYASGGNNMQYITIPVLISLLVCLLPTTIGGLLSAIGISGMDRMIKRNIIATSGKAVEAAGDLDVLLLDKTGTITLGNRMASDLLPARGVELNKLVEATVYSSLSDETPEGRSILKLAKEKYNLPPKTILPHEASFVKFSAETKMSGADIKSGNEVIRYRKGSYDAIQYYVESNGGFFSNEIMEYVNAISSEGGTPLVVCRNEKVLGVIKLKDIVKGGIKDRFAQLRRMGIKTVMITGDNPITAAAIAAEAGVDDFLASAKPEDKLKKIREEQATGHLVGMIGDGTNDAPALAQSDVGIAMNSGTQAAREAGNMVDLDSDPTKLIEVVEIGKQLLMTRGALTTFSIANDIAKYFAILPAMFIALYSAAGGDAGPLAVFNIMKLSTPYSAILSAVIFNALIIILLIPFALKGIKYKPLGASVVLRRNLLIYGLGGIVIPFIGIKLIDMLLTLLNIV
jgi:K+-transporting ATPase ATPase B chain